MMGEYTFGSTVLRFRVEPSQRRKSASVIVDPHDGIVVKAPEAFVLADAEAVVARKAAWIVQRLADQRESAGGTPPREFVGGESHRLQGRQYRLRIDAIAGARKTTARVEGGFIVVEVPLRLAEDRRAGAIRGALVELYRDTAAERLPERVAMYAEKLGVSPPPVLIRDQQKRWGSCTRSGELRFNWRIIMGPMSLVDYVAAHEVCHLRAPDHSPAFWRLLGNVMPDHEERRERLRVEGGRYEV